MSSVSEYEPEGDYTDLGNQLIKDLTSHDEWEKATAKVGKNVEAAEDRLARAFALTDSDKDKSEKLAKELGVTDTTNPEVLQIVAKTQFERAHRVLDLINAVLDRMHEAAQRIINNIGRA